MKNRFLIWFFWKNILYFVSFIFKEIEMWNIENKNIIDPVLTKEELDILLGEWHWFDSYVAPIIEGYKAQADEILKK